MSTFDNIFNFPLDGLRSQLATGSGLVIANGYDRIVIGDRGPYVEIAENDIVKDSIVVQEGEEWRLQAAAPAYYVWLRSNCESKAKVYYQLKRVAYADYIPGMYYVSPWLVSSNGIPVIEKTCASRSVDAFFSQR